MKRLLIAPALWVLAGLILGLIVHILSVFALPNLAPDDARARLEDVPVNQVAMLGAGQTPNLPLTDPAFQTAVCRYDLSDGMLHVRAPVTPHYTAVALYTSSGLAFGAINDKAATRRWIDLFVVTAAQRREIATGDDETQADNLIMVSPTTQGFVLIRALAVQPGFASLVRDQLAQQSRCEILAAEQAPSD
jgi:uncharacterized membrane protein